MRYAQIDKALLSVLLALERFHVHTYGVKVLVENDHKPLEVIQKKSLHNTPLRLQRMLLGLQKYDFTIKHKAGKNLVSAFSNSTTGSIILRKCKILTAHWK